MDLNREMGEEVKKFCEYWLRTWAPLEIALQKKPIFQNPETISVIIAYECQTRQRINVLDRLSARRAKLIRRQEWNQIQAFIKVYESDTPAEIFVKEIPDAGESDRELLGEGSGEDRRESC